MGPLVRTTPAERRDCWGEGGGGISGRCNGSLPCIQVAHMSSVQMIPVALFIPQVSTTHRKGDGLSRRNRRDEH